MTRNDIIRLAHEAGLHLATEHHWMPIIDLSYAEKFAALVVAAVYENEDMFTEAYAGGYAAGVAKEREACAKVVEPVDESLADEIRARGER